VRALMSSHAATPESGRLAVDANALSQLKAKAKSAPDQALAQAAGQFEALFMQMLLKSMREALPQDGPLSSDTARTYTGMFDSQLAQTLSRKGLGIADMLVKQLSPAVARGSSGTPSQRTDAPRATRKIDESRAAAKPVSNALHAVTQTAAGFIEKLRPHAEAVARAVGVPAQFLLAQAALETGWGKSQPKSSDGGTSHNLFGIKAGNHWKGPVVEATTTEYVSGKPVKTMERFRSYASYTEALADFANLLRGNPRYAAALSSADGGSYATNMQRAGYATDPHYAEKLARTIQTVTRHTSAQPSAVTPVQVRTRPADNRSTAA